MRGWFGTAQLELYVAPEFGWSSGTLTPRTVTSPVSLPSPSGASVYSAGITTVSRSSTDDHEHQSDYVARKCTTAGTTGSSTAVGFHTDYGQLPRPINSEIGIRFIAVQRWPTITDYILTLILTLTQTDTNSFRLIIRVLWFWHIKDRISPKISSNI